MSAEVSSADFTGRPSHSQLNSPQTRALVEVIREGLITDGQVRLHNFGTFRIKWSRPHRIVHPRTGESMIAPAHPRVVFVPAAALRDAVEPNPRPVLPFYDNRKLQDYLEAGVEGLPAREHVPPPNSEHSTAESAVPPEHEQTAAVQGPVAEPKILYRENPSGDEARAVASAAMRVDVNTLERDRNSSLLWAALGVSALALIPAILFLLQQDVDETLLASPDSVSGAQTGIVTASSDEAPPLPAVLGESVSPDVVVVASPSSQVPETLSGSESPATDQAVPPLAELVATGVPADDGGLVIDDRFREMPAESGDLRGPASDPPLARTADAPLSAALSSTGKRNEPATRTETVIADPVSETAGGLEPAAIVTADSAVSITEATRGPTGDTTVNAAPTNAVPGDVVDGRSVTAGKQVDQAARTNIRALNPAHQTVTSATSDEGRGHTAAPGEPDTLTVALAPGQHRVRSGDNLWRLAEAAYGDARMWPAIYQANADILTDPNLVEQGQVLTLPARDANDEPAFRTRVAEGYYLVYQYLRDKSVLNAHHFLIAAVRFDRGFILARREEIPPQDQPLF